MTERRRYVLVLDHGTTGIKLCLMTKDGNIAHKTYQKVPQIYPQPGWVEHDATGLWELTVTGLTELFLKADCNWQDIDSVGITNQRETAILWDKNTGAPIYNAIVWQCRRTADACKAIAEDETLAKEIQNRTGLVVDAYFSATKIQWLLNEVPEAKTLLEKDQLLFGTVDTWILWKLTGGKVHATDMTNASRTLLFNIQTRQWDKTLLDVFDIPASILPSVQHSTGHFGTVDSHITNGVEIPIMGMAGDQQAALYGQLCWQPGDCKNTFGTGAFLMVNTGESFLLSKNGLLTTLACDAKGEPCYAFEGAIFIAGAALEWLKDNLGLMPSFNEADNLAQSIENNGGVYFVPAFVGLGAPYWNPGARGLISGLTQGTTRSHLVRAAYESMAYQTVDMIALMRQESALGIPELKVDGGVSQSKFLMQFLADMTGISCIQMSDPDLTAKGVGYLSGLASGFWTSPEEIQNLPQQQTVFTGQYNIKQIALAKKGWKKAIELCLQ